MTIADYIKDHVLEPRLREKQVVVLYDDSGQYRDLALSAASEEIRVIDAGKSIVKAREDAMEAVARRGRQPEKNPNVLIYVPSAPPSDEDARCADFFSALVEAGDSFPKGDSDSYLELCLQAKPDFATRLRELFSEGAPTFDAVDAIGAGGGDFPRLKTELGCESNAEILGTLLVPETGTREAPEIWWNLPKGISRFPESYPRLQTEEVECRMVDHPRRALALRPVLGICFRSS